ncbi:MAG: hypothetical protein K6G42_01495 [Lachnospiraceae bacterium]|nr:hypothetical protein [Lachnospiraceae bacterium]
MNVIWKKVSSLGIKNTLKNKLFIGLMVLVYSGIGTAVWLLAGRLVFPQTEWLLCFIAYPAVFMGFFGGIIYLYNHEFLREQSETRARIYNFSTIAHR